MTHRQGVVQLLIGVVAALVLIGAAIMASLELKEKANETADNALTGLLGGPVVEIDSQETLRQAMLCHALQQKEKEELIQKKSFTNLRGTSLEGCTAIGYTSKNIRLDFTTAVTIPANFQFGNECQWTGGPMQFQLNSVLNLPCNNPSSNADYALHTIALNNVDEKLPALARKWGMLGVSHGDASMLTTTGKATCEPNVRQRQCQGYRTRADITEASLTLRSSEQCNVNIAGVLESGCNTVSWFELRAADVIPSS